MALKDAPADSFNRYMVECKFISNKFLLSVNFRFNRYMVECKSDYFYYLKQQIDVLIDTWWNVNQASHCISESGRFGFNRYKVECIKYAIEYIRNWTTDEF